eukprot:m.75983 g.75983  ORF g.75983 m.75983 type:complete len:100 (+) comp14499_c0_seq1:201-500(+)
MAAAVRRLLPLYDRVLVRRVVAETTTKSGFLLPEAAAAPVNEGVVVAVGPGLRTQDGNLVACAVKEGDNVLLPDFGGTKITLNEEELLLFRDSEILGTL